MTTRFLTPSRYAQYFDLETIMPLNTFLFHKAYMPSSVDMQCFHLLHHFGLPHSRYTKLMDVMHSEAAELLHPRNCFETPWLGAAPLLSLLISNSLTVPFAEEVADQNAREDHASHI